MAYEVILEKPPLDQLFSFYSEEELVAAERSKVSLANEVYDLTTENGQRYIMKLLKSQTTETAQHESVIQAKLTTGGINTARYIELPSGGYVGEYNSYRFTLSEYLEGQTPVTASLGLVKDIGSTLGKLHNCLSDIEIPPSRMQLFDPINSQGRLRYYVGDHKEMLKDQISKHNQLLYSDLPQAVIHGDLWLGNIFAEEDKVTAVFDMETAERTCRILDLARTYLSLRIDTKFPPQILFNRLMNGYDSTTSLPITLEEHHSWKLATAYVAGVCATWQALQGIDTAKEYIGFMDTDQ